jgi:hypothetical protein
MIEFLLKIFHCLSLKINKKIKVVTKIIKLEPKQASTNFSLEIISVVQYLNIPVLNLIK